MIRRPGRPRLEDTPPPAHLFWRTCERCGRGFEKDTIESWGRWLRRKFCGQRCYQESRRDDLES